MTLSDQQARGGHALDAEYDRPTTFETVPASGMPVVHVGSPSTLGGWTAACTGRHQRYAIGTDAAPTCKHCLRRLVAA